MTDILNRFNSGRLWDFPGGIHPAENKSQSNQMPISSLTLPADYYVPVKQHAGSAGSLLVKAGDKVLKGQPLTRGDGLRALPVHAPTSGTVVAIEPYIAAHPSGLKELSVHIRSDGKDQWTERHPVEDFLSQTPEQLIEKIYQAGIAGLGGAVFPTAAKIHSAEKKVKLLIINGAECEPYITCDDRLMRDYPLEIIEGVRILRYILRPEQVVIAIEDNKPEAIRAVRKGLEGSNDIEVRVIPTKYPSGAAKQLIQILTGMEVPKGERSSAIGVLMHNVGTAFAIKRAVINDEPMIERVITLTGDKIRQKGNYWVRFGTPINQILQQVGYQPDERFPVFVGGPMMGLMLPDLSAPVGKSANCLLAPDHFEYNPLQEEHACIRCSACSDACPVRLMPQQMYWFARSEEHEKSEQYSLFDCIECGLCAYVCPSNIPLIQYFRREKAKIRDIQAKAKAAEDAKQRFEARQARLEKEKLEREARAQRAAAARREELAQQKGIDPVQAALERIKAKQAAGSTEKPQIKTITADSGEILPDNTEITALRKARRLARQQTPQREQSAPAAESAVEKTENPTALSAQPAAAQTDAKKAAIAAAIARAKAKKAQTVAAESAVEKTENPTALSTQPAAVENDAKKAAVAAAIARAKAKKAQTATAESAVEKTENPTALSAQPAAAQTDAKKAAVAAAIARAKAKKAQTAAAESAVEKTENPTALSAQPAAVENDAKKAAVAAAIARAKAKKTAMKANKNQE